MYYMAKCHEELDRLIGQVGEADGDEMRLELFGRFKAKLEQHMLTEERSIFSLDDLAEGSMVDATRRLYKDHIKIKAQVAEIEASIRSGGSVKLTDFIQTIFGHHKLEDETLYPYLDHHLAPERKRELLAEVRTNLD